jgi:hypothetical protein
VQGSSPAFRKEIPGNPFLCPAEFFVDFASVADLEDDYGLALDLIDDAVVAYAEFAKTGKAAAQGLSVFERVQYEAVFYGFADAGLDVLRKARDIPRYFGVIFRLE